MVRSKEAIGFSDVGKNNYLGENGQNPVPNRGPMQAEGTVPPKEENAIQRPKKGTWGVRSERKGAVERVSKIWRTSRRHRGNGDAMPGVCKNNVAPPPSETRGPLD